MPPLLWDSRDGSLSTQVLQEFYAVVTRKLDPAMSRRDAHGLVAVYGEWCDAATEPHLIEAASRLEDQPP
jgi:predicted nucleic acid-binding protein